MKKPPTTAVFAERVDKLTRSIENAQTGESFPTEMRPLPAAAARKLVAEAWVFKWGREAASPGRQVYQLNTVDNQAVIQGLISLEAKPDHVFMHLIESAEFNKGQRKAYLGVLGNLVAYACRWSFQLGHAGFVSFDSKTALKAHYKKALGAQELGAVSMYLGTRAAVVLVKQYYPDFFYLSAMATKITSEPAFKLGYEPPGIDLTPIFSRPYTEAEEREISAFFQKLRAENAKDPEIVALLEAVARQQGK